MEIERLMTPDEEHIFSHTCPILTICMRSTNQLDRRYVSIHQTVVTYRRTVVIYSWTIVYSWYRQEVRHTVLALLSRWFPPQPDPAVHVHSQSDGPNDRSDPSDKAVYGRTIFYRWIYSNQLCSIKIAEIGNVKKA